MSSDQIAAICAATPELETLAPKVKQLNVAGAILKAPMQNAVMWNDIIMRLQVRSEAVYILTTKIVGATAQPARRVSREVVARKAPTPRPGFGKPTLFFAMRTDAAAAKGESVRSRILSRHEFSALMQPSVSSQSNKLAISQKVAGLTVYTLHPMKTKTVFYMNGETNPGERDKFTFAFTDMGVNTIREYAEMSKDAQGKPKHKGSRNLTQQLLQSAFARLALLIKKRVDEASSAACEEIVLRLKDAKRIEIECDEKTAELENKIKANAESSAVSISNAVGAQNFALVGAITDTIKQKQHETDARKNALVLLYGKAVAIATAQLQAQQPRNKKARLLPTQQTSCNLWALYQIATKDNGWSQA